MPSMRTATCFCCARLLPSQINHSGHLRCNTCAKTSSIMYHRYQGLDCSAIWPRRYDSCFSWCWMTATEVNGINEFKEPSVRVHLGASFILLLKQVLRLFCLSRGLPFLGCIGTAHWSNAFDLDARSTNLQQFPASQDHCLLLPLAAFCQLFFLSLSAALLHQPVCRYLPICSFPLLLFSSPQPHFSATPIGFQFF